MLRRSWLLFPALLMFASIDAHASGLDVKAWLARPGVKLLAVEFYATWCKPCMAAVPRWKALHEKYRDRGLRLVVVATQDPNGGCTNPGWNPDEIVCDDEGQLAERFQAKTLPSAFLWSWQGRLLVRQGHVGEVESSIESWLKETPRVDVEVGATEAGASAKDLETLVRDRLQDQDKLIVVATEAERKKLTALVAKSYQAGFDDKLQCEVGKDLSANSLLKASINRQRLSLSILSAERKCLIASSVVNFARDRASSSIAEGVSELFSKLRIEPELPWGQSSKPMANRGLPALSEPAVEKTNPIALPTETMKDLNVKLLKTVQEAVRTEKSEKSDDAKASAWDAVVTYDGVNPMKAEAEKRRDHYRSVAANKNQQCSNARVAFEQRQKDRDKLRELIALDDDVVSREQKDAAKREFDTTYAPYKKLFANLDRECPGAEDTREPDRPTVLPSKTRSASAVRTEIARLERLAAEKSSPDRAVALMRLGSDYVELMLAEEAAKDEAAVTKARAAAIITFNMLTMEYPNYASCDSARATLGELYLHARDFAQARRVYFDLIKKSPGSVHVPYAYLIFGELFMEESRSDQSKADLAIQAYKKVIEYPGTIYLTPIAWYRMGKLYAAKGDCQLALRAFLGAAEDPKLAAFVQREIVPTYASCGSADGAATFFKRVAGTIEDQTLMLDRLATAYVTTGKLNEAAKLYKVLMTRESAQRCHYQVRSVEVMATLSKKDVFSREIGRVLDDCPDEATDLAAATVATWTTEGSKTMDAKTRDFAKKIHKQLAKRPSTCRAAFQSIAGHDAGQLAEACGN